MQVLSNHLLGTGWQTVSPLKQSSEKPGPGIRGNRVSIAQGWPDSFVKLCLVVCEETAGVYTGTAPVVVIIHVSALVVGLSFIFEGEHAGSSLVVLFTSCMAAGTKLLLLHKHLRPLHLSPVPRVGRRRWRPRRCCCWCCCISVGFTDIVWKGTIELTPLNVLLVYWI